MDSRISIAGKCFETGLLKGSPVGTCLNCGNQECEKLENPCNCPSDCSALSDSDYVSAEEYCGQFTQEELSVSCEDSMTTAGCQLCYFAEIESP